MVNFSSFSLLLACFFATSFGWKMNEQIIRLQSISGDKVLKCMEDTNVTSIERFKQILIEETGKHQEEICLRKCLYEYIYLLKENGEINISTLKDLYTRQHLPITDQMMHNCEEKSEAHKDDGCQYSVFWVHCFLPTVRFEFRRGNQAVPAGLESTTQATIAPQ